MAKKGKQKKNWILCLVVYLLGHFTYELPLSCLHTCTTTWTPARTHPHPGHRLHELEGKTYQQPSSVQCNNGKTFSMSPECVCRTIVLNISVNIILAVLSVFVTGRHLFLIYNFTRMPQWDRPSDSHHKKNFG